MPLVRHGTYLQAAHAALSWRLYQLNRVLAASFTSRCYLGGFECIFAIPLHRVIAAGLCLANLAHLGRIREGIDLALALLPTVHTHNLDRSDQETVPSGFAGIISDLFASLIAESRPHEAVECLEQGRAIIISRLLNDRSDISNLRQEHPMLGKRYQSLLAEINLPLENTEDVATKDQKVTRCREAVTELKHVSERSEQPRATSVFS